MSPPLKIKNSSGDLSAKVKYVLSYFEIEFLDSQKNSLGVVRIFDQTLKKFQFSPQFPNDFLVSGSQSIRIYLIENKKISLLRKIDSNTEIQNAFFGAEKRELFWNSNVELFKTGENYTGTEKLFREDEKVSALSTNDSGKIAASFYSDPNIKIYEASDKKVDKILQGHHSQVNRIEFDNDEEFLFSLDKDLNLFVWSLKSSNKESSFILNRPPKRTKSLKEEYFYQKRKNSNQIEKTPDESLPSEIYIDSEKPLFRTKTIPLWKERLFKSFEDNRYQSVLDDISILEEEFKNDPSIKQLKIDTIEKIESRQLFQIAKELFEKNNLDQATEVLKKSLGKDANNLKSIELQNKIEERQRKYLFQQIALSTLLFSILTGLIIFFKKNSRVSILGKNSRKRIWNKIKAITDSQPEVLNEEQISALRNSISTVRFSIKNKITSSEFEEFKRDLEELDTALLKLLRFSQRKGVVLAQLQQKLVVIENDLNKIVRYNKNHNSRRQKEKDSKRQENKKTASEEGEKKEILPTENYYELLNIPEKATQAEIKKAYRQKLKEYHPDKHNSSEFEWIKKEAEQKTKKVRDAFEILGSPQKRAQYDKDRKK